MTNAPAPHARQDLLGTYLTVTSERARRHLPKVASSDDPKHIHQARVNLRRIRTSLRACEPALQGRFPRDLWSASKSIGSRLGPARDADVTLARLSKMLESLGLVQQGEPALDLLRKERKRALKRAQERIQKRQHALVVPASLDCEVETLTGFARSAWADLRASVAAVDESALPRALHEVRLSTKRARYVTEIVAPALGEGAGTFTDALAELQTALGEINDATVFGRWLERTSTEVPKRTGFALGIVAHANSAGMDELRTAWLSCFQVAQKAEPWSGAG